MKARQIQARFWDDEFVQGAKWQSRYVFIYLCTCLPINMSGIFQLSEKKIIFETGLSEKNFVIAKEELSKNKKVLFFRGWILVCNAFKNCKVWKSKSNWKAWEEEWSKVSKEVKDYFDTGVGIDVYINQKQEIDNEKHGTANQQGKVQAQEQAQEQELTYEEEKELLRARYLEISAEQREKDCSNE